MEALLHKLLANRWTPVSTLTEPEKAEARLLFQAGKVAFHNGVIGPPDPEVDPDAGYVAVSGGLRRATIARARAAPNPAAAVTDTVAFVFGWQPAKSPWALYGKFANRFATRDQLALFLLSKAHYAIEGDPVADLLPLAVAISNEPTNEELAKRRRDIEANAAELQRLRAQSGR